MVPNELGCSVRRALVDDASLVHGLLLAAFEPIRQHYTPSAFAATVLSPNEALARIEEGPIWIAERSGDPVGTVSLAISDGSGYIRGMAVTPEARGIGAGRSLMASLENEARALSIEKLWLLTTPFLIAAIALYEQMGFEFDGDEGIHLHGTPLRRMTLSLS